MVCCWNRTATLQFGWFGHKNRDSHLSLLSLLVFLVFYSSHSLPSNSGLSSPHGNCTASTRYPPATNRRLLTLADIPELFVPDSIPGKGILPPAVNSYPDGFLTKEPLRPTNC